MQILGNENNTILDSDNLNGRVNIIDIPYEVQFQMQEKVAVRNKTTEYRDALQGIYEDTVLSKLYFSEDNIQIIQNGLRAGVYKMSNNKYVVAPQNIDTLKIIMRSTFLQYAQHDDQNITAQISRLNNLVLEYAVPNVYNEVEGYVKYRRDQSTLVTPLSLPQQPDRDYKQLEMKTYV